MATTKLIFNVPGSKRNHRAAIVDLIRSSKKIVISSGWMKLDGLDRLMPAIDHALSLNAACIVIYSNEEHTPDSVVSALSERDVRHVVVPTSHFYLHSKIYYFEQEHRYTAIIGSANITHGGLTKNEELSVRLDGTVGDEQHRELARYLDHLSSRSTHRDK